MGKYDPLRAHLLALDKPRTSMSFEEVGFVVGGLPRSAFEHRAWWSNEANGSHVQARAWLEARHRVESVDLSRRRVTFLRA